MVCAFADFGIYGTDSCPHTRNFHLFVQFDATGLPYVLLYGYHRIIKGTLFANIRLPIRHVREFGCVMHRVTSSKI